LEPKVPKSLEAQYSTAQFLDTLKVNSVDMREKVDHYTNIKGEKTGHTEF